ncbi:MAG: Gar1/Naf1 family protein [Methanoregula sp.]
MKVVGRAMSTYGSRMLLLQCDAAQLPGLYSEVTDRRTKPVGRIVDVFGNVKAPYALVFTNGPCSVTPGEKVFAKAVTSSPANSRERSDGMSPRFKKQGEAGCRKSRNSNYSRPSAKRSNRV